MYLHWMYIRYLLGGTTVGAEGGSQSLHESWRIPLFHFPFPSFPFTLPLPLPLPLPFPPGLTFAHAGYTVGRK